MKKNTKLIYFFILEFHKNINKQLAMYRAPINNGVGVEFQCKLNMVENCCKKFFLGKDDLFSLIVFSIRKIPMTTITFVLVCFYLKKFL